jgi:hypothetical protein
LLVAFLHDLHQLVLQAPSGWVGHTEVALELQGRDAVPFAG